MTNPADIDLNQLPLNELKALQKSLEKAIQSYEGRRLSEARAKLEAHARELGISLSDVLGAPVATSRKPTVAKFQDPSNPENTWSGRGRKPGWYASAIEAGKSPDDLLIA